MRYLIFGAIAGCKERYLNSNALRVCSVFQRTAFASCGRANYFRFNKSTLFANL